VALSTVPAPLQKAIDKAAKKENVPADILAAIWRHESGSTFPNPYVNSEGYGGLFGTKDWRGSTQNQANYAATILHNLLVGTHGNLADALGEYGTGHPDGGAYLNALHALGATSSGIVPGYGGSGGTQSLPAAAGGPGAPNDSSPGSGAGTDVSLLNPFGIFGSPLGDVESLTVRLLIGFGGVALLVVALILISKAVTGRNLVLAGAGFVAGKKVDAARKAERVVTGQRSAERHEVSVAQGRARVKTEQARATELRTRVKHRRAAGKEAQSKAYYAGARDAAMPNMTEAKRRSKRKAKE